MSEYLYVSPGLEGASHLTTDALSETTERHQLALGTSTVWIDPNPLHAVQQSNGIDGVVIGLAGGIPNDARLRIADAALSRGLRVWLYWPGEQAIECVDRERLESLKRHRYAVIAMERLGRPVHRAMEAWQRMRPGLRWIYRGMFPVRRYDLLAQLGRWSLDARPVSFPVRADGTLALDAGLYLRTDFWVKLVSGGSYGHTCYVAKELAATAERFAT